MTIPSPADDSAGVLIPAPFIYVAGLGAGLLAHRAWPATIAAGASAAWARIPGVVIVLLGLAIIGWALLLFVFARTSPMPMRPTTAIVERGPYRFTRNPMYVGMAALYLGITLWANSWWPLPLLPLVLFIVNREVIAREERYLSSKFGDPYRRYLGRVRRWL